MGTKYETEQELDVRRIRIDLRMNQEVFWSKIGMTQSAGSRYENERRMPKPVVTLVDLVYVKGIDISKFTEGNMPVIKAILSGGVNPVDVASMSRSLSSVMDRADGLLGELQNIRNRISEVFIRD